MHTTHFLQIPLHLRFSWETPTYTTFKNIGHTLPQSHPVSRFALQSGEDDLQTFFSEAFSRPHTSLGQSGLKVKAREPGLLLRSWSWPTQSRDSLMACSDSCQKQSTHQIITWPGQPTKSTVASKKQGFQGMVPPRIEISLKWCLMRGRIKGDKEWEF